MTLNEVLGLFDSFVDVTIIEMDTTLLFSGRKGDVCYRPLWWRDKYGQRTVKTVQAVGRDEIWIYIEEED